MGHKIFSLGRSAKPDSTNRSIIRKLTEIRVSGYPILKINQEIGESNYAALIKLAKDLGDKILKVNLIKDHGTNEFLAAKKQFYGVIDNLVKTDKFSIVFYAAQLLQYYTIICNINFIPNSNLENFQQFLSQKKHDFGNTDNNLFITEYKLILIYNELSSYLDLGSDSASQLKDEQQQNFLSFISQQLELIKKQIDTWIINTPNHIFLQYLYFIHQYTSAKLIEFQYTMKKEVTEDMMLHLAAKQLYHLNLAKEVLNNIDQLSGSVNGDNNAYTEGSEFSLGQDLFHKLPETNANELKKHILSLIAENSSTSRS